MIDGINTQVTYLPEIDVWNIASSNYSLVANT
jgi:hypothetical protein